MGCRLLSALAACLLLTAPTRLHLTPGPRPDTSGRPGVPTAVDPGPARVAPASRAVNAVSKH